MKYLIIALLPLFFTFCVTKDQESPGIYHQGGGILTIQAGDTSAPQLFKRVMSDARGRLSTRADYDDVTLTIEHADSAFVRIHGTSIFGVAATAGAVTVSVIDNAFIDYTSQIKVTVLP